MLPNDFKTKEQQIASIPQITEVFGRHIAEKFAAMDLKSAWIYINGCLDGMNRVVYEVQNLK